MNAFEQGTRAGASAVDLQSAVNLYRGDLLPACYDDWIAARARTAPASIPLGVGAAGRAVREAEGDYGAAIELARRLLSRDPLREASYRLLMRLHLLNGDRGAALHVYHSCASVLQEELGVEPDPATRRQYEQLHGPGDPGRRAASLFLGDNSRRKIAPAEPRRPVFVARERELARLDGFLNLALGGQCRIVFVTGDPGQGKTALVQEFARRAQAAHPELVVAGGNGNAYTGQGDPYVPFREILSLLSGEIQERWAAQSLGREQARRLWHTLPLTAQALVEAGPDLVDTFVSGAPLAQRAAAYAPWPGRADWLPRLQQLVQRKASFPPRPDLNQNALFEQYARVMRAIARRRPLLLTLDDLQWADGGSVGLLFHLGRSLAGGRVLVVGAYRPTDIALGRGGERHPLEPVVNEFKLQWGDIEIDLREAEGERFVAAYLDTEPNRLGEAFRTTLFRQTAGLPLATVELVREMQERGGLVRDGAGYWTVGPELDWSALPVRVEAMIADRIARLDERARRALQVASVEGETFTAEVIARVVGIGEQDVVRLLSEELDRGHRLVKAEGVRHLNGRQLSIYRFRHILFQKYLYTSLDAVERSRLHDAVGTALETFYAAQTDQIVAELARHFEEAGTMVQAADYLVRAGDRALSHRAPDEAIGNYEQAMTAYQSSRGEGWDSLQRAVLERKLGEAWFQKGEHRQALDHLRQALAHLGRPLPTTPSSVVFGIILEATRQLGHRLIPGLTARAASAQVAPEVKEAAHIYETMAWIEGFIDPARLLLDALKFLNLSESHRYAAGVGSASMTVGAALDFVPLYKLAEGYHRRAIQAAEQTKIPAVHRMAYSGMAFHNQCLARFAVAGQYARQAARICEDSGDLHNWGWTTDLLAIGLYYLGEHSESLRHLREVETKGRDGVDLQIQCWSLCSQGAVLWRLGAHTEGIEVLQRAIGLADEIPDYAYRIGAGGDLGWCYLRQGQLEHAFEALHTSERIQAEHPTGWGVNVALYGGLAAAYVMAAELADQTAKAQWLKKAGRACRDALRVGSRNRQALPEAMRLRGTYEWLRGNAKSAQTWWQRSIRLATQLGIRYDLGMAHLEMGLRLHDRAHLVQGRGHSC